MPVEFAANLSDRIRFQQHTERFIIQKPKREQWGCATLGDYANRVLKRVSGENKEDLIPDHFPTRTVINSRKEIITLQGYEVFLHDIVLGLLQTKAEPVVMLDLGGGAGTTWNRLAIAMRDEIEQGRLAMVVSNLVSPPEHHIQRFESLKSEKPDKFDDYDTDQIRAELTTAEGLVHYVNGPFFTLRTTRITLPTEETIRLDGNIDFVNEKFSLTKHGFTPDLDILIIGYLLSKYGIYVAPNYDINHLEYPNYYLDERREGITIAHRRLQEEFGLTHVTEINFGEDKVEPVKNHQIFAGPLAPQITVS